MCGRLGIDGLRTSASTLVILLAAAAISLVTAQCLMAGQEHWVINLWDGVKRLSYAYRLSVNGYAEVTVVVKVENMSEVRINLEPGYVKGSLTSYSENGTPLYSSVINSSKAVIYTYGLTGTVIIEYLAKVGNVTEGVLVNAVIHPKSRAIVFLPLGAALTYASGGPDIEFVNGSIALIYRSGGVYRIQFIVMPRLGGGAGSTSAAPNVGRPLIRPWIPWLLIAAGASAILVTAFRRRRLRLEGGEEFEVVSGLDDRDLRILKVLVGGELSLSEIARRVGLNKSVVWRRVNRLMRDGFLERRFSRGRTLYRLTVKGVKALEEGFKGEA